jgi:hypothetical protein
VQRAPLVAGLLVAASFVALVAWTWGTWCDPLVDFGRELYVPWRIRAGEVLYRDIAWFNGPLSQYWNAGLFTLFGASLRTLVVANLALAALTCGLVYRLGRSLGGLVGATTACLLFLALLALPQQDRIANFNWICPYSHELTHGVLLALLAYGSLLAWRRNGGRHWALATGLATGLCALTKPEVFAATLLALGVGLVLTALRPAPSGARARQALPSIALGGLLPPLAAFGLLATAMPAGQALRGTIGGWAYLWQPELTGNIYYLAGAGFDNVPGRLGMLAGRSLAWLGLLAGLLGCAVYVPVAGVGRRLVCLSAGLAGGLGLVLLGTDWHYAWLPLPLFILVVAGCQVFGLRRASGPALERRLALLVLAALALGLLAKMPLHARLYHYGFGLALPALLLLAVTLCGSLARWLDTRRRDGTALQMGTLGLLAIVVLGHLRPAAQYIAEKTVQVGSGADAFRAVSVGGAVQRMLAALQTLPPDATVVVLPEGVMLNWLSRRRNPTRYASFMPPEVMMFGEQRMLAALQAHPPDYVVLWHRLTFEYGVTMFGRDYGQSLMRFIRQHYTPVREHCIGIEPLSVATTERWGMWLAKRR